MQKYICKHCDNLECQTSICPNCGQRTELVETTIFYCNKCNVPVFDNECEHCHSHCERIGSDIRPVFAQERLLLEVLIKKPFEFAGKSVWCSGANNYIVNGKRIRISFSELSKQSPDDVINELKKYEEKNKQYIDSDFDNVFINKFIECNKYRLNQITTEAVDYIKGIASKFDDSSMFVSFSGGKDSSYTESPKNDYAHFIYKGESGQKVNLAGTFTNWDPWIYELKETSPGLYELELPLPAGKYYYNYYIGLTPVLDNTNPKKIYTKDGRSASVLTVN